MLKMLCKKKKKYKFLMMILQYIHEIHLIIMLIHYRVHAKNLIIGRLNLYIIF